MASTVSDGLEASHDLHHLCTWRILTATLKLSIGWAEKHGKTMEKTWKNLEKQGKTRKNFSEHQAPNVQLPAGNKCICIASGQIPTSEDSDPRHLGTEGQGTNADQVHLSTRRRLEAFCLRVFGLRADKSTSCNDRAESMTSTSKPSIPAHRFGHWNWNVEYQIHSEDQAHRVVIKLAKHFETQGNFSEFSLFSSFWFAQELTIDASVVLHTKLNRIWIWFSDVLPFENHLKPQTPHLPRGRGHMQRLGLTKSQFGPLRLVSVVFVLICTNCSCSYNSCCTFLQLWYAV